MENTKPTSRRTFLSTSLKGTALLAAGLTTGGFLQSFTAIASPESELEFRKKLGQLGTLSLMTSQLALTKASNKNVKLFATFEAEEQKAVSAVLKEMATPVLPMDAKGTAVLNKLKASSGAAFDKAFMSAQVDTHVQLKSLVGGFVTASQGATGAEMHTRHIATVALATIKEHVEVGKRLLAMLK
jgi:putative membrane protein